MIAGQTALTAAQRMPDMGQDPFEPSRKHHALMPDGIFGIHDGAHHDLKPALEHGTWLVETGMLNPLPSALMLDDRNRPYFLWDLDMTADLFKERLDDPDPQVSGYFHGKLMRQARPDDVFEFTSRKRIRELWPRILPHLGKTRDFWSWILVEWERCDR